MHSLETQHGCVTVEVEGRRYQAPWEAHEDVVHIRCGEHDHERAIWLLSTAEEQARELLCELVISGNWDSRIEPQHGNTANG